MQNRRILKEKKKTSRVTNGDRSIDPLNVALFDEDFHGFEAESLHFRLLQRLTSLQLLYLPVQVCWHLSPSLSLQPLLPLSALLLQTFCFLQSPSLFSKLFIHSQVPNLLLFIFLCSILDQIFFLYSIFIKSQAISFQNQH